MWLHLVQCLFPPPETQRWRCSSWRSTAASSMSSQNPLTSPGSWQRVSVSETPRWDAWSKTPPPGPVAPSLPPPARPTATRCWGDGRTSQTWPRADGTAEAGQRCTWRIWRRRRPGWRWGPSTSSTARSRCCRRRFASAPAGPGPSCPCEGCRPGSRSEGPHLHETPPLKELKGWEEKKALHMYLANTIRSDITALRRKQEELSEGSVRCVCKGVAVALSSAERVCWLKLHTSGIRQWANLDKRLKLW